VEVTGPSDNPTYTDAIGTIYHKSRDIPSNISGSDLIIPFSEDIYSFAKTICLWAHELEGILSGLVLTAYYQDNYHGYAHPPYAISYFGDQFSDAYCQAEGIDFVSGSELTSYHTEIESVSEFPSSGSGTPLLVSFKDGKDSFSGIGRASQYMVFQLKIKAVTDYGIQSAMGATLSGASKWEGGVLGSNNKIYGIPYSSTDILIIDPIAGTASRSAMGASLTGAGKWAGGVLGSDNKIYGIPFGATDILIIDPVAGTASRSSMGADLSDTNKFIGGVLGSDNKIYGIPFDSLDILIIDPAEGTATRTDFGLGNLWDYSQWYGGVLASNNKIYCMPNSVADILIIDPIGEKASRSSMGADFSSSNQYRGGALGSDNKIYGVPFDVGTILNIDTEYRPTPNTDYWQDFIIGELWIS
jgi:hypothetical protein